MQRRTFIGRSAAILAAPLCFLDAAAEQPTKRPVIGFLGVGSPAAGASFVTTLRQGLSEISYVEGLNVAIEYRWAEGHYDRLPALAADLVGRKVDLIAAGGTAAIQAAKSATSTIPIFFTSADDPVAAGLVASLARPGGNVAGFSLLLAELEPKRFELLYELVPQAGVIALLVNPNGPRTESVVRDVQEAARAKRVQLRS